MPVADWTADANTRASYVQDGLIAQWNAIDNEGIGALWIHRDVDIEIATVRKSSER